MLQAQSPHRGKKYLGEVRPELLSDNLFDVPEDIFSESDSDDSVREINIVWPVQSESESSTSSEILQMHGHLRG
jgi:hypothetical protein